MFLFVGHSNIRTRFDTPQYFDVFQLLYKFTHPHLRSFKKHNPILPIKKRRKGIKPFRRCCLINYFQITLF